jgi:hypothetical protein
LAATLSRGQFLTTSAGAALSRERKITQPVTDFYDNSYVQVPQNANFAATVAKWISRGSRRRSDRRSLRGIGDHSCPTGYGDREALAGPDALHGECQTGARRPGRLEFRPAGA